MVIGPGRADMSEKVVRLPLTERSIVCKVLPTMHNSPTPAPFAPRALSAEERKAVRSATSVTKDDLKPRANDPWCPWNTASMSKTIENVDLIDSDRCGHGAFMEVDCSECDYENMLADQDRYSF